MAKYFNSVTGRIEDDGQEDNSGKDYSQYQAFEDDMRNSDNLRNNSSEKVASALALSPLQFDSLGKMSEVPTINPSEMNPEVKAYLMSKLNSKADSSDSSLPSPSSASQPDANSNLIQSLNPIVAQTLLQKNPSLREKYSLLDPTSYDAQLKAAQEESKDRQSGLGWAQFAAGFGDALAGRSSAETAKNFQGIRQNIEANTVGALEARRNAQVQGLTANTAMDAAQKQSDLNDPNSRQSKVVQNAISKLYPGKFTPEQIASISASDQDLIMKPLELDAKLKEQADNHAMRNEMMKQSMADRANKGQDTAMGRVTGILTSARGDKAAMQAEADLYAVKKVDSLVNLYGDPNKLNPTQVQLLASEIGKIATGGIPTNEELKHLTPSSIPGSLATIAQKMTNNPTPANQGAFVKAMQDYTTSLKKDAQEVIKERYGRVIESNRKQLGEDNYKSLQDNYINRFNIKHSESSSSTFPRQVSNGKQIATVSNQQELDEAKAHGFN